MTADKIVDILLDSEDSEAAEFFNSYLLKNPSLIFTGPGSFGPHRSEVGDNELSMGTSLVLPRFPDTRVDVQLWIIPHDDTWHFRVHMEQKHHLSGPPKQEQRMMNQDLVASTPEQKFQLIAAIQDFLPQAREILQNYTGKYGSDVEWIRQALYTPFYDIFIPLYNRFHNARFR